MNDDAERAPRLPLPIDQIADALHERFSALERRLDSIEASVHACATRLQAQPSSSELRDELEAERARRRQAEQRIDELEAALETYRQRYGTVVLREV